MTTKNDGTNSTARQVEAIMPLNTVMPIDLRALAPAPVASTSGSHAEDEGERGHQDRPEPRARRLDRRFDDRLPSARSSRATSTIRMAFLADSAISRIRPIWT